jgi:hypothetical protein
MKLVDFLEKYEISSNKEKWNFFQIAGFPHYELVFSNVFAFLIENEQLIYQSLLDCLKIESYDKVEEVIREDITDENKRIDITLKTTDRIIGIENKIEADLYNDTENYYHHLNTISKNEKKELVCIILSKKNIHNTPINFINILHIDLANSIKKYYTDLSEKMDKRYFQILSEFIENIQYLQRGAIMNEKFVKLLDNKQYRDKISNIIENYNAFKKEIENKAKDLFSELNTDKLFEKKKPYKDVNDCGYFAIRAGIEKFLAVKNYEITIDVNIEYNSFSFYIIERKEKYDPGFYKIIKDILPDYDENYHVHADDAYVCYNNKLTEYDKLLDKLKEVINNFKNYKKQKHGT